MINGIINVLKPTGMSSHDVIGQVRRIYGMKKVGHAGTLDPLAAGVLPIYLGQATRLIQYGGNEEKRYHAEFQFGIATDTEDSTGEVVATGSVPDLDMAGLDHLLDKFRGTIEQMPSRYSAVNINGVKAYKLARKNVEFTLPSRQVTLSQINILTYEKGRGIIDVTCSKGTYMRSLIRDLGEAAGSCACMTYLVRVRAGIFDIADAASLEALEQDPQRYIMPMDAGIQELPKVVLEETGCRFLLQGRPVPYKGTWPENTVLRIYGPDDQLKGIATYDASRQFIRPHKMFTDIL